jgi:hypothetical protein
VLFACKKQLASNWGNQNYSQIILVTDVGIGLCKNSIKSLINSSNTSTSSTNGVVAEANPLPLLFPSKVTVMCLGSDEDVGFKYGK